MLKGWNKIAVVSAGLLAAFLCKGLLAGSVGQPSPVDNMKFPYSQEARNVVMTSGDACPTKEEVMQKTQTLQVPFIANNGQVDEKVSFYARTFGGTVFVTKDAEIVYSLPNGKAGKGAGEQRGGGAEWLGGGGAEGQVGKTGGQGQAPLVPAEPEFAANDHPHSAFQNPQSPIRGVALKEHLVGGKINEIRGGAQSVTTVSYFKGNDPSKWKSNLSTYQVVDMGEVYKGIGLRLKAYGNNVEKLFTVTPDASPDAIKLGLSGARSLNVNDEGQLVAETELGPVKFTKPIAYQEIDGKQVEVGIEYRLSNPKSAIQNPKSEYGFTVASYDRTKDLIIDPLLASTYLGGNSGDYGRSIAIDPSNNVYVLGYTSSADFPVTSGAYGIYYGGGTYDVLISKLNSGLTSLLASTFLGGSGDDQGYSFAIVNSADPTGSACVYVTGFTTSSNFPTTSGAYDTSFNQGYYYSGDVFVSKLNSGLTSLLASTYLGGNSWDYCNSLALDSSGNVYVTGNTKSDHFPTTNGAFDNTMNSIYTGADYYDDVFVSKLNSGLTTLLASTYLGGDYADKSNSIALDSSGNVYVMGYTSSLDFPTTSGTYDTSYNGGSDVFVTKLNNVLTGLLASTYLGGNSADSGSSLTLDTSGNVYVTGYTSSTDFPTTSGAYDTSHNGGTNDTFVSKLDSGLSSLLASTFLGGTGSDYGRSIALNSIGRVFVTGDTGSTDFPTTSGAYNTAFSGDHDAFVSKLNANLTLQ